MQPAKGPSINRVEQMSRKSAIDDREFFCIFDKKVKMNKKSAIKKLKNSSHSKWRFFLFQQKSEWGQTGMLIKLT